MNSTSSSSADVEMAGDNLSLIDFSDTNFFTHAFPGADETVDNLNLDDYLVFPPQGGADKLQQSPPAQTVYYASVEPSLGENAVDASELAACPGLDFNAQNLGSSSSSGRESVDILPSLDSSTELPTLARSREPTLAEAHIDHHVVSSSHDTS
jgi:hypothetical protein